MYEFKPKRTNDKARNLVILFFIGSAALLLLSIALDGIPFLWVIQLFAVILLAAAVFLVTRYIMRGYIYRIEQTDGGADLTVTEISSGGRRQITVCRISLLGIKSAEAYGADRSKLREYRQKTKKIYDYRVDLAPEKSIALLSEECGESSVILLAFDDRLLEILGKENTTSK